MRASVSQLEVTIKELEESLSKVHMEGTVALAYKKVSLVTQSTSALLPDVRVRLATTIRSATRKKSAIRNRAKKIRERTSSGQRGANR